MEVWTSIGRENWSRPPAVVPGAKVIVGDTAANVAALTTAQADALKAAGYKTITALDGPVNLVTASALLDLVSAEWLERLVNEVAARRLPFYAALNYDTLDAFKRACQRAAATTTGALAQHGLTEPASVRGESAYLIETDHGYLAHVEEGLGTKNLVADAMLKLTGRSFYENVGIDTVATIVKNDQDRFHGQCPMK